MNNKTKFAQFIDSLTLILVISLITYWIFSIFLHEFKVILCLSIFATIAISLSIKREISKRRKKISLSREQEKLMSKTMDALKYGNPRKIHDFFIYTLSKSYKVTDKHNYLIIEKNEQSAIFMYDFTTQELTLPQLSEKISRLKDFSIPLYFSATNFTLDAVNFAKSSKFIILLDQFSVFSLLQSFNIYPKIKISPAPKNTYKNRFLSHLNRNNFFKLLRYSILLFLISYIIPFSTYYRLGGIILLILSIISFFKPIKKSTTRIVPLETN